MNNNINSNNTISKYFDMESFTSKLKKEDDYNLNLTKAFFWIYIGFIVVYSIIMIVSFFFDSGLNRILSQTFFILTFVSFVLIFRYNLNIYKKIDYSLPLAEMLNAVVKRYKLGLGYFLILLIPIALMDTGLTLSFYEDLEPMHPMNRVLIVQAFYIPIMALSIIIGLLIWKYRQKPLRDKALELLKELES